MYATRMNWSQDQGRWRVALLRDGVEIAQMTLDEWVALDAVRDTVDDAVTQAVYAALNPVNAADDEEDEAMQREHIDPAASGTAAGAAG